jgi:hypothetical protein
MDELPREQQDAVRTAIMRALEPLVKPDGVHLTSIANIASAEKPRQYSGEGGRQQPL